MKSSALSGTGLFKGPQGQEDMPYLLTPGPLTTSRGVKLAMLADWGSRDVEFRQVIAGIRQELLALAGATNRYECVLLQGSGTYAIEAALGCFCPQGGEAKTLVIINGAYGERAAKILERIGNRPYKKISKPDNQTPNARNLRDALKKDDTIEAVFMVHCETTSGIVNPIEDLCAVAKEFGKTVIVDAMSSFGALPVDVDELGIDALVSSSNKCIEGVPGFSYAICTRDLLEASQGKSHSTVLDLYDQWQAMEKNGQFRFTPPTHTLVAFYEALKELHDEGGPSGRRLRYNRNKDILVSGLKEMGFETFLNDDVSGPIIQTFVTPQDSHFDFETFYGALRERGFAIYPGKLTGRDSFRIGTIGQLNDQVMEAVIDAIRDVLREMGVRDLKGKEE